MITLHEGARLAGRYRIVAELGRGDLGVVHHAHDEMLGAPVALKIFWPRLTHTTGSIERLRRQIAAGRGLPHSFAQPVFDFETAGALAFVTMGYVEGENLERVMRRGALPEGEAGALLQKLARALAATHASGAVHGNLKPTNVLVDARRRRVVLADFGMARDVAAEPVRGTPAYFAPERVAGAVVTPACDVYAFGLIAYRLLSGRHFAHRDLGVVPAAFRAIVAKCLAEDPAQRYPSARALDDALLRARRIRASRPAIMAVAAAALVVSGVGVGSRARAASITHETADKVEHASRAPSVLAPLAVRSTATATATWPKPSTKPSPSPKPLPKKPRRGIERDNPYRPAS